MNNTSPAFPEFLCILLFMAFVVGLAYMGFNVSRNPSPDLRTTMEIADDSLAVQTILFEACVNNDCYMHGKEGKTIVLDVY